LPAKIRTFHKIARNVGEILAHPCRKADHRSTTIDALLLQPADGSAARVIQDTFAALPSEPLPQCRTDPGQPCHQPAAGKANS